MNTKSRITLATLPQATAQEVFDQVKEHLLTQGKRSRSEDGRLAYRGNAGTMCAIGCLMSDSEALLLDNNMAWEGLHSRGLVPSNHHYLLCSLQHIHDTTPHACWEKGLMGVAVENCLSY